MLINNTDALKSWLVVILEPLCDADSSALARYVLALLKKDKPELELKRVMIEQLDVFLGDETKPFVDRLFAAINSEEYLRTSNTSTNNMKVDQVNLSDILTKVVAANSATSKDIGNTTTNIKDDNMPLCTMGNSMLNLTSSTTTSSTNIAAMSLNSNQSDKTRADSKTKDAFNVTNERSTSSINHQQSQSSFSAQHQELQSQNVFSQKQQSSHNPHNNSNKIDTTMDLTSSSSQNIPNNGMHVNTNNNSGVGPEFLSDRVNSQHSPPSRGVINIVDKENQSRDNRRRRPSLRSRSRSNERFVRRSRSRDRRINEREKSLRQFRNKSPPVASINDNRHERRRGSGATGNISGSNSIERRRTIPNNLSLNNNNGGERKSFGGISGRGTNRSPNLLRSRSTSVERNIRNKRSPSVGRYQMRSDLGNTVSEIHEKRQRCRDFDEKGYCVRGETCPWDHGVNPVVFEDINNSTLLSMSMREYNPDAPDLWSRTAPPTGGLVTGETSINPYGGTNRQNAGLIMPGGSMTFPPVSVNDKIANGAPPLTAVDYVRSVAVAAATGAGYRSAAPILPFPYNAAGVATPLQRELIPIPVVEAGRGAIGGDVNAALQGKRRFELEDSVAIADGPTIPKRKLPAHSRLGPRVPGIQNCSLELRKVPRGLNTIAHLNNHFAKFGKIVNIQISYEGDPEAAIITFSTHAEANVAYRSTEAVLNNRFIKVFWHTTSDPIIGSDNNTLIGTPIGPRRNSQYHLNNVQAMPTPTADSAKTVNTSQSQMGTNTNATKNTSANDNNKAAAQNNISITTNITSNTNVTTVTNTNTSTTATHVTPPSLRLKNNISRPISGIITNSLLRKKQEQVKAVVQLANGLRKRKQELLQSYVKQMKSALDLVERCEANDPQRTKTLDTVKILQQTIDKLRKEIAAEQEQIKAKMQNQKPLAKTAITVKKTKEQQKKELLDIELELFAQQQEGNDTSAIQKRLEDLQRSMGIMAGHGNLTTASAINKMNDKKIHYTNSVSRNRTRVSFPEGSNKVDRRPKTIIVTGFNTEETELVFGHFKHFGEITKHDIDFEKPQIIISYATRLSAEQAVLRGKIFKDKRLQILWTVDEFEQLCETLHLNEVINSPFFSVPENTDTLPELEDEEEDDESEDRSWRR